MATYFADYDRLLVFDYIPDDDVKAFVETLDKLYWRHVGLDEEREEWLPYLRRELKEYVDNFEYRSSGRFLLRLSTLIYQVQKVALPSGLSFDLDNWRKVVMERILNFIDRVVIMMYPRDLERLSLKRFVRKRKELDQMVYAFTSSVSLCCRLPDDTLVMPLRLDRFFIKLSESSASNRTRKRRRVCKPSLRNGPLARALSGLKKFLCGGDVSAARFQNLVSPDVVSRFVELRPYLCIQPSFDPAKGVFVFRPGFYEPTDTRACFGGFKNYSKVIKPLGKITEALRSLVTEMIPVGDVLDLDRISNAGLHVWREVNYASEAFLRGVDALSLTNIVPGATGGDVNQVSAGETDGSDVDDQGSCGSENDAEEESFGQCLPKILRAGAFRPRMYRLPDGQMAFIESDPYVVDTDVAPTLSSRLAFVTRMDSDDDQLLAKYYDLNIWESSFFGFILPSLMALGTTGRFFRASLGLDDVLCRKLNVIGDLHEIISEEFSSSGAGTVSFETVIASSNYNFQPDEVQGLLSVLVQAYKLRASCFKLVNSSFLDMAFVTMHNLRSDLLVGTMGTVFAPLWGKSEDIGPSVHLTLQASGFHLTPGSFSKVEGYRSHPYMGTRDRISSARGCVAPTSTIVAKEVPEDDRYKDALAFVANSVNVTGGLLSSDAEVREREFSNFVLDSCDTCPSCVYADVGDAISVVGDGLKFSAKFCIRCVPLRVRLMSYAGLLPGDVEFVRKALMDRLGLQKVSVVDYFEDAVCELFPGFSETFDQNVEVQRFQKEAAILRLNTAPRLDDDRCIRGSLLQFWAVLIKPMGTEDAPLWVRRTSASLFRTLSLLGVVFNFGKESTGVDKLYQRSYLSQFTGVEVSAPSLRSGVEGISGCKAIFNANHPLVAEMRACGWLFPRTCFGKSVVDSFKGELLSMFIYFPLWKRLNCVLVDELTLSDEQSRQGSSSLSTSSATMEQLNELDAAQKLL